MIQEIRSRITTRLFQQPSFVSLLVLILLPGIVAADEISARGNMEDPGNPLLLLDSSRGDIFIELFPREAPQNVARILALINGEIEFIDPLNGGVSTPRYYDGLSFHRVFPNFLIQTGNPFESFTGTPIDTLGDEINATFLGLDQMPVLMPDGTFNPDLNIASRQDLEQFVLLPLYRTMRIDSSSQIRQQQDTIEQQLRTMTMKQAYENLGYNYTSLFPTRPINRGIVALANSGPDSNGTEFFIVTGNADGLSGRYTVIGHVVEGMDVADQIDNIAVNPENPIRGVTRIYTIQQL